MAKHSPLANPRVQEIIHIFLTNQAEGMPPPTIRDILILTDITSTSVVNYYCQQLVELSILDHVTTPSSGKSRKYIIANKGWIDSEIYEPPELATLLINQFYIPGNPFEEFTINSKRASYNKNSKTWHYHDRNISFRIEDKSPTVFWKIAQTYPLTNNDSHV